MRLTDRIRRWWNPAQWRDEHPEERGDEADRALSDQQRPGSNAHPGVLDRYGDEHAKGM
jgi:hypothetical protein